MFLLLTILDAKAQCAAGWTCTMVYNGSASEYAVGASITALGGNAYIVYDRYDVTNTEHDVMILDEDCTNASCSSYTQLGDYLMAGPLDGDITVLNQASVVSRTVFGETRLHVLYKDDTGCVAPDRKLMEDAWSTTSDSVVASYEARPCGDYGLTNLDVGSTRIVASFTEHDGASDDAWYGSRDFSGGGWTTGVVPDGNNSDGLTHDHTDVVYDSILGTNVIHRQGSSGSRALNHSIPTYPYNSTVETESTGSEIDFPTITSDSTNLISIFATWDEGGTPDKITEWYGWPAWYYYGGVEYSTWIQDADVWTSTFAANELETVQSASTGSDERQFVLWSTKTTTSGNWRATLSTRCEGGSWLATPILLRSPGNGFEHLMKNGRANLAVDPVNNLVHVAIVENPAGGGDGDVWWIRQQYTACP